MKTALMTPQTLMLPATSADLPALQSLWSVPSEHPRTFEVTGLSRQQARHLLAAGLVQAEIGLGWWLVYSWITGSAFGCVGLLRGSAATLASGCPIPDGSGIEAAFAFKPEAWASGYAEEAIDELLKHACAQRGLPRLDSSHAVLAPADQAEIVETG